MISLRDAVLRAHEALFADVIKPSDEAFDAIATVLARYVQVYRLRAHGHELVTLTKGELASGRFANGGTRFEFVSGEPSIDDLAVVEVDLRGVLKSLTTPAALKERTAAAVAAIFQNRD